MDNHYAQSARRRAKKQKALREGQQEQQRLEAARKQGIDTPLWEHRPSQLASESGQQGSQARPKGRPGSSRVVKPGSQATRKAGTAPQQARPRPQGAARSPSAPRSPTVKKPAGPVPAKTLPSPKLQASEERRLLESPHLDLFNKGQSAGISVCPDCSHELTSVNCLGTTVKVCVECKGTWLPYSVVQDFARSQDWFRQLGRAFLLVREKTKKKP